MEGLSRRWHPPTLSVRAVKTMETVANNTALMVAFQKTKGYWQESKQRLLPSDPLVRDAYVPQPPTSEYADQITYLQLVKNCQGRIEE